jgi:phosphomethylpyrimidine synthase
MKITQEVREFAARQNAGVDNFLAAHPEPVEGQEEAEAGMAEMSERFREEGGELYLPEGPRPYEHGST